MSHEPNNENGTMKATIACLTDVGRVRKGNEDAFIITDLTAEESLVSNGQVIDLNIGSKGVLLAVADGMGGAQAGDVASRMAIGKLSLSLVNAAEREPVSNWLSEAIRSANRVIRQASQDNTSYYGMGATMTAAIIQDGKAFVGQVGDSRGYLIREGQIEQITKDQSLIQSLIDEGTLTEELAAHSPYRNVILHAIGAEDEAAPVISVVSLVRGDYLLLCSDGLSNKVGNVELHDIVCEAKTLSDACTQLIALANERGGEDNITAMLGYFGGTGFPEGDGRTKIRVEHPTDYDETQDNE